MTFLTNVTRSEGDPKVISTGSSSLSSSDRMARNLGWFSIGLGLVEMVAARRITRALGMRGQENLVRAFGVREIASGFMTLSVDKQVGLATRIGGDALDIAALATALHPTNRKRNNAALALLMVTGIAFLDVAVAGAAKVRHLGHKGDRRTYGDRSGFPKGVEAVRGAGRTKLQDARPTSGNEPRATKKSVTGDDA
ncbi:hypothetical protein [Oryzifoliimicrobium ureilyticus]|uniref:hypothetical protein n=1 Tax=Oryzifoliimicrobium ureilyticus TaxID=3113724 RepID=UPI003076870E